VKGLPLSTLLSQALVAYTIEFDNAFEQDVPHTTTVAQGAGIKGDVVWLVSQAMWTNFIRFVAATAHRCAGRRRRFPAFARCYKVHPRWVGGPEKSVKSVVARRRASSRVHLVAVLRLGCTAASQCRE
jgi:hypothetical protein